MGTIKKTPMASLICSFLPYLSIIASNNICVDVARIQLNAFSLLEVVHKNKVPIPVVSGVAKNQSEGTILLGAQEHPSLYSVWSKIWHLYLQRS